MKIKVTSIVFSLASAATAWSANLLVNPDAEDGLTGWTVTGTTTQVSYETGGGWPTHGSPGPLDRGDYFWDGGEESVSSMSQLVDLASLEWAGGGGYTFTASGWLGGYLSQSDHATITIQFFNESGELLGSEFTIGPVTSADREGVTGLFYRELAGQEVPFGAGSAEFTVTMRASTPHNDGYVDNLSFDVTSVPEPGSNLLFCLASLAAVLRHRRRF